MTDQNSLCDMMTYADKPDKGTLVPTRACKVLTIMAPLDIPNLIVMLLQNNGCEYWNVPSTYRVDW